MSALLLNGRELAARIREKTKKRIADLGLQPGLAVFLVGADPASHLYVNLKERACAEVGIHTEVYRLPADLAEEELIARIAEKNDRPDIHGILVQLPLPSQNADRVVAAIAPNKDVDGFHPENLTRLEKDAPGLAPPVALAIMKLIEQSGVENPEAHAVVVSSGIFARPLCKLLLERALTCEVVSVTDPTLEAKTATADILVTAVGEPGLITGAMVKPGAVVIDVGTTRVGEAVVGDVERATVEPIAGALTPVPGGVGPMTVAMLLVNVVKAAILAKSMNTGAEKS